MKKILLAGILGGIVLFIWSALAWTVLPLHKTSIRTIPNEEAVISALRTNVDAKGMYMFPGMTSDSKEAEDAWTQKYKAGPVGMIVYDPIGSDPMMPGQFVWGIVIDLIAGILGAWLLSRSTAKASSYFSRVIYFGVLGVFISFATHITFLNWLGFPLDYTTAMVTDTIIGWLLAGLAMSAVLKAPKTTPAAA